MNQMISFSFSFFPSYSLPKYTIEPEAGWAAPKTFFMAFTSRASTALPSYNRQEEIQQPRQWAGGTAGAGKSSSGCVGRNTDNLALPLHAVNPLSVQPIGVRD